MDTTNHYRIKAVDFCTSNYGYFLKVTVVDGGTDDRYTFVYIPFASYPSILMTDFLMARKETPTADLLEALQDAVKRELEGKSQFLIIAEQAERSSDISDPELLGSDTGARPTDILSEFEEASRPSDHDSFLDDAHGIADRPIADNNLKVFRDVFLGKHPQTRTTGSPVDYSKVAYRIIDNKLYLDFVQSATRDISDQLYLHFEQTGVRDISDKINLESLLSSIRDISDDVAINNDILDALRQYTFNLLVGKEHQVADRPIHHEGNVEWQRREGVREITNGLIVMASEHEALREMNHNSTVMKDVHIALRDHTWGLIPDRLRLVDRVLSHSTINMKQIQARLDDQRKTHLARYYLPGRLLHRQYPASLLKEIQAVRDSNFDTWLDQQTQIHAVRDRNFDLLLHTLGGADRYINRATAINWENIIAEKNKRHEIRPNIYHAMLHPQMLFGHRVIDDQKLHIGQSISWGFRPYKVGASVQRENYIGGKHIEQLLYIPRAAPKGYRPTDGGLYVPREVPQGKRPYEQQLLLENEVQQGGRPYEQQLYIDSVQYRAQRFAKDTHIPHDPTTDGGFALPRAGILEEEVIGQKQIAGGDLIHELSGDKTVFPQHGFIDEQVIAHVQRTKGASLDDLSLEGQLIKKVLYGSNMEELFWANVIQELPAHLLEDILADMGYYGEIMDDLLWADRDFDGGSWLMLAEEYGIRMPNLGFVEPDYLIGVKQRMMAILESEISSTRAPDQPAMIEETPVVGSDILRPAEINIENPLGYFEAQPAVIPEGLEAGQEPKPSIVGEGLEAAQEAKPSVVGEELLAQEPGKPAFIGQEEVLAQKPRDRSGDIGEEVVAAQKKEHSGMVGQELLAQEPGHSAVIGNELIGQDTLRPAVIEQGTDGKKAEGDSLMEEVLLGQEPMRPADLGGETIGNRAEGLGTYDDSIEALKQLRPTDQLDDGLMADFQKRVALLSTGYIFADKPVDRAAYIADMYLLAEMGIKDGFIDQEDLMKYAHIAIKQGIIGEQMFGSNPGRASELLEHILAFTDPFPTHMNEDTIGFTEPYPTHMSADLIAKKQEHFSDLIGQIVGDKELGQAVIEDYLVAQERLKEGYLPDPVIGKEELKKALLEQGLEAQSFVYDYNNDDLLFEGDDPEFWEEGFGIPEEYDPKDPFNPYYPWVDDLGTQRLDVDDWIRFGPGTWTRDRQKYEFYSKSDVSQDGGYYRNDFSATDYVFTIDFKVDEDSDGGAGIVFRYKDDKNYTKFTVYGGQSPTRHMALSKMVNGTETWMGSPMNPFNWVQGQWYRLEVSVLDSRIKIKVNSRLQYDLVD